MVLGGGRAGTRHITSEFNDVRGNVRASRVKQLADGGGKHIARAPLRDPITTRTKRIKYTNACSRLTAAAAAADCRAKRVHAAEGKTTTRDAFNKCETRARSGSRSLPHVYYALPRLVSVYRAVSTTVDTWDTCRYVYAYTTYLCT